MTIEPLFIQVGLGFLGTGILAGLGFILRSLNQQNQTMFKQGEALAVLVATVKPAIDNVARTEQINATVISHDGRIKTLEAGSERLWGIYDAWTQTRPGTVTPTIGGMHHG